MKKYDQKKHKKYLLFCHLIFSTKYRRKIFTENVKSYIKTILNDHTCKEFTIKEIETDKDHIHI